MGFQQRKFAVHPGNYYAQVVVTGAIPVVTFVLILMPANYTVEIATKWQLILFFLVSLFLVYPVIAMSQYVELMQNESLKFHSCLGARIRLIKDLREITIEGDAEGVMVVFRFDKEKFRIPGGIDGLEYLFSILRTMRPNLVVRAL
jgi:hypothetical protein